MTNEERRKANLTRRGLLLSEIRAWSGFSWSDAPWFDGMMKDRAKITRKWARQRGVNLREITPEQIRHSLTYQQAVREFYSKNGWTKQRIRHEPYGVRKSFSIDPYAMMRHYSDEYSKGPGKKDYMPPWRKRERTRRDRTSVIDQTFSTATGLKRI